MRFGGWWRLWVGLSVLWIAGAAALVYPSRPSVQKLDREVANTCGIENPMSPQYAAQALQMRDLLNELDAADIAKDDGAARRIAAEIIVLQERSSREAGAPVDYSLYRYLSPEGDWRSTTAPQGSSRASVEALIAADELEVGDRFQLTAFCLEQLNEHADGTLYSDRKHRWLNDLVISALSLPALLLILGAMIGWIWRGFRSTTAGAG